MRELVEMWDEAAAEHFVPPFKARFLSELEKLQQFETRSPGGKLPLQILKIKVVSALQKDFPKGVFLKVLPKLDALR